VDVFRSLAAWVRQAPFQPADDYALVSALFLRLLALVYLAAFASLWPQVLGLAGSDGILPLAERLGRIAAESGVERYWQYPTLFWIDASDTVLRFAAVAGCLGSLLLFLNILPRTCLILLFALYLSLFHAGWVFMNFQWDYLLLESGFLALLLSSGRRVVIWLYRWLLFRLRFLSGATKLLSQDPSWAGFTALLSYFEVQPLPHTGAWYAHQLPDAVLQAGVGLVFFAELVVPFLMFLSRGPRFFAAWVTIGFQLLILLTSNHNFFNLLTIFLCLFLFDDRALSRALPGGVVTWLQRGAPARSPGAGRLRDPLLGVFALAVGLVSSFQIWELFSGRPSPQPVAEVMGWVAPFRVVNKYHVFPTMKTERLEVVIEGSADGETWLPYAFKYKPGDTAKRPAFLVPYQPRLDWMMWFLPLGFHPVNALWYGSFLERLLQNSPAVTGLLRTNPFAESPPRYLRASLYRYRFTSWAERRESGDWWRREYVAPFYPWPWIEAAPPEQPIEPLDSS